MGNFFAGNKKVEQNVEEPYDPCSILEENDLNKFRELVMKRRNRINDICSLGNDEYGTILYLASRYSKKYNAIEKIRILLECDADINLGNDSYTPLMIACRYSNTTSSLETVKFLIKKGANINYAFKNKNETVEINTRTRFTIKKHTCNTALMVVCRYINTTSNIQTLKLLLENRVDPHTLNMNNQTAYNLLNDNSITSTTFMAMEMLKEYMMNYA